MTVDMILQDASGESLEMKDIPSDLIIYAAAELRERATIAGMRRPYVVRQKIRKAGRLARPRAE